MHRHGVYLLVVRDWVYKVAMFRVGWLQPGIRVVFRVRYRNAIGWSQWSRVSCPIDTAPDVPDAPVPCAAKAEVRCGRTIHLRGPCVLHLKVAFVVHTLVGAHYTTVHPRCCLPAPGSGLSAPQHHDASSQRSFAA